MYGDEHVLITADGREIVGAPLSAPPSQPVDVAGQRVARARAAEYQRERAARARGDELVVSLRPGDRPEYTLRLARLRAVLDEQARP
jgi:hypothetical protein